MSYYKVGTHINFKRQAQIKQLKEDAANTAFWSILVLGFLYCLYA